MISSAFVGGRLIAMLVRTVATTARRRRILLKSAEAYLFILPALLILSLFNLLPAFAAPAMSTMRWGIIPERFIGLDNYVAILDPSGLRFGELTNSLGVTIWYVLLTVPVEMALGRPSPLSSIRSSPRGYAPRSIVRSLGNLARRSGART